jgi:cell wall-associated NlpC family hydrolase
MPRLSEVPLPLKDKQPGDDHERVQAARRLLRPRRLVISAAVALCACVAAAVALASGGNTGTSAAPVAPAKRVADAKGPPPLKPHPRVVQAVGPGEAPPSGGVTAGSGTVTAQQSDAEIRGQLTEFRQHLTGVGVARGAVPSVRSDGTAVAPRSVPDVVAVVIAAGNEIATKPYKWGGGHGAWSDTGYDCSGSVSFALAGAGLLDSPLDSRGFMRWGDAGPGRYISIYANDGHAFMVVAGLRFDTSGAQGGTRWQPANGRSYDGFVVRHPPGL